MSNGDTEQKLRIISFIALLIVLIVVGYIVINDTSNTTKKNNYLDSLPAWAAKYDSHLQKYYKLSYEIAFIDLDLDNKPEAIIKQSNKNTISYTILDLNEENKIAFKYNDINDIRMIYSLNNKGVSWYITTSLADEKLHIIDIQKRIKDSSEYEEYLDSSDLSNFKKNNINLNYKINYITINEDNYENNFSSAIQLYDKESKIINNIITETIN